MFEVTVTRLEAIAMAQIAIASILIADETSKAVETFGAASPLLALGITALEAATAALTAEGAVMTSLIASRAVALGAAATVTGVGATSAGASAALTAAVEAIA